MKINYLTGKQRLINETEADIEIHSACYVSSVVSDSVLRQEHWSGLLCSPPRENSFRHA